MGTTITKDALKAAFTEVMQELGIPDIQNKRWWTLTEAAELKGINYKTICNRRCLQPLGGQSEGLIGGRKKWRWETIKDWIELTDDMIIKEAGDE